MGRSRYPRFGYRLAPRTLRELLQQPVPPEYSRGEDRDRLSLGDLDESSWERFGEEACRELAAEVVRSVGRAARQPMPIAHRRLPPIPRGMRLVDLELEARTINCLVSAGMHERPQDLRVITIEGILGLRGFWVKCLVDLLTSLEYVADHPEVRRRLRNQATGLTRRARASCSYPRPGERLAPETLREILSDPVPPDLFPEPAGGVLRLCDLNEEACNRFPPQALSKLGELIVARVSVSGHNRLVQKRRLPSPPEGMRLEDLRLENRTLNCLEREGFGKQPGELGKRTVGQLLAIRSFGAKCLVDLLSSLETLVAREGKLNHKLTIEAEALARTSGASQIHFNDPRLGRLLRATDTEANTVAELVDHVIHRRLDPPDPLRLYERIAEVRRKVQQSIGQTLEGELIEIFSPRSGGRDRQIIAQYHGWDGGGGCTLEALGRRYGLSRERIRQVCVRAVKRIRHVRVFAPVLDRALAFIVQRLPMRTDTLQAQFDTAGFSACRLRLETVRQAATLLARPLQFALVPVGRSQVAVKPEWRALPRAILQAAKRAVVNYGATTIRHVAAEASGQVAGKVGHGLVREVLEALPDFEWLDGKRGWFELGSLPQYGLPNMIEKVLSVARQIDVTKLRAAIARYRRVGKKVPPAGVLLEFCRRMSGVRVEGTTIIGDPPRDWRDVLAGVEAGMVRVLTEHGPVMERSAFEECCVRAGMNRFSFNAIIMCSPVIAQYGRSVYGLLGAKVDRKTLRSLSARTSSIAPSKVLRGFASTEDGQVYLAYRLSKAAISGGVITVPAAMRDRVRGKFEIRMPDGRQAGTLVSKNGCAWGLGPVLRGHRTAPGDHLLIVFNPSDRVAQVHIGGENVLEPVNGRLQPVT